MKLQLIALCGIALALPAFGEGGQNQIEHQMRFGDGHGMPQFLAQYDADGDGQLSVEEQQVMERVREQIRKQLMTWDTDGDGQVGTHEQDRARERLRELITECREDRFNDADTNEDGYLDFAEFSALPGMARKLNDDNPDNDEVVQMIFDRMAGIDTEDPNDPDGTLISLGEFLAAVAACEGPQSPAACERPETPAE